MRITFHGAARHVTGSKHLITLNSGTKILLDCGLFQGEGADAERFNRHFGFNPKSIDYVLLSHAHIDHSGLIPRLVREGFRGKIFCTHATKELCRIMLEDSAEIHESDFRYDEKRNINQHPEPLYEVEDAEEALKLFEGKDYNDNFKLNNEVEVMFTDAGHILGSAVINLIIKEDGTTKTLAFTGDIGRYDAYILRDPQAFPQVDYLICESTYGNKNHESHLEALNGLRQIIIETCGLKKGKLIIPAFSLGKTQDLVYHLNKLDLEGNLPPFKVFVDSPLALQATEIVRKQIECYDPETIELLKKDDDPFSYKNLTYITKPEDSRKLNDFKGPCIIIASSGMAEAGRVRHHLIHHIEDERTTILFTSYAPQNTLAGKLKRGDKQVKIFDRLWEVRAAILSLDGMSAHAGKDEMLKFLSCQDINKLKRTFLVHGEYEIQLLFAETLESVGHRVEIPGKDEYFDL